jgi:hypothetical protein
MLRDQREALYYDQLGFCATCHYGMSLESAELAHKIPEAKWAVKKYGFPVVDHVLNKAMTHRGYCNDQQLIQNRPAECDQLAAEIRKEIERESKR